MARKTTPPAKGVSGKKAKKKRPGQYKRTKALREKESKRAKKQRAETPPTPAQQQASRENGQQGGRPSDYKPEHAAALVAYFDKDPTRVLQKTIQTKKGDIITVEELVGIDFPTVEGFARSIKVSRSVLHDWADAHPEFAEAMEFAKTCQANTLLVNGMHGHYMQPLTVLFAKNNMGYREKVALGGDDDSPPIQHEHQHLMGDELAKRRAASLKRMKAVLGRLDGENG